MQKKSLSQEIYQNYVQILKEELLPAMGCTEPISIAYAAAKCRDVLGEKPEHSILKVSGNLIKNVKSVIVPNTGGMKGLEAAVAAGVAGGHAEAALEVLAGILPEQHEEIRSYLEKNEIEVELADTNETFYIDLSMRGKNHSARVVLSGHHTNIILVEKDGAVLQKAEGDAGTGNGQTDRSCLNIEDIITFAETAELDDVREFLERQINYNTAIAREGLQGDWGARVGKTFLNRYPDSDIVNRAKAYAAAGSDARMDGCSLPVVIVSGSGNQGMTASLPVIVYADALHKNREELMRALIVSNLTTIYQKTDIGCLSAFCGAVSAGAGAGAGIAFLFGGRYEEIAHTIVNALAILSGMTCDGAKASCAAKIAAAVDAGIFGYQLYLNGNQFYAGDGIVTRNVDGTIHNVGRVAKNGMRETDKEILNIMVGK